MYGVDLSRYNMVGSTAYTVPMKPNSELAYRDADFVIVKATQGTSYKYTNVFGPTIARAWNDDKLIGAYHYAAGGDPIEEAKYFLSVVEGWLDAAILVLDWEATSNEAWGNTNWAKRFLDYVYEETGIRPFLYSGMSGLKQCTNCYPDYGLWFAGYPVECEEFKFPEWPTRYKTDPWPTFDIWQYSSAGGIDRNYTSMTKETWLKWARKEDSVSAIDKLIEVAEEEIGYLEKKSNSNLDSKTGNAGSGNYTKYWRDLYRASYNGAWCQAFVDWCFMTAFGKDMAKKLLHMETSWSYYTPNASSYFKNHSQWHTSNPKRGDIIYFRNSERICHVGIVWKVSGSTVYTIEGNTSGASGVIANGGGVCKKSYSMSSSYIAGYGRPNYSLVSGETEKQESATTSTTEVDYSKMKMIKQGNTGKAVKVWQAVIGVTIDGKFGPNTKAKTIALQKKAFPKDSSEWDGIVGPKTWKYGLEHM